MKSKTSITALVRVILGLVYCNLADAGIIKPEEYTNGALSVTEFRIQAYFAEHHCLPGKLSDMPERPDYDDRTIDGWGNQLGYDREADGSVRLSSPGKKEGNNPRALRFSIIAPDDEDDIDAEDWTYVHMRDIEHQMGAYAKVHHKLPETLAALVNEFQSAGLDIVFDGWNHSIEYKTGPNGSVTLSSRGKTGKQIFASEFIVPGVKTSQPATAPSPK